MFKFPDQDPNQYSGRVTPTARNTTESVTMLK